MSFTLKVRYRDAAVFFVGRNMAGYMTENEGNRCARKHAFNVKTTKSSELV